MKRFLEQSEGQTEYLPKESEDGGIDWYRSNNDIRNYIRALTKPYPGAITFFNEGIIKYDAIPFDIEVPKEKYKIGEVVKIFNKKDFLIRTRDSFFLLDYDIVQNTELKEVLFCISKFFKSDEKKLLMNETKYPDHHSK